MGKPSTETRQPGRSPRTNHFDGGLRFFSGRLQFARPPFKVWAAPPRPMLDLPSLIGSTRPPVPLVMLSSLVFLVSFVYTVFTLGTRRGFSPRINLILNGLGFVLQTQFLITRGQFRGRCPLTNLFEVIVFLCWALVFFYLVVGNTYRLSPLGMFTAPLVCALQLFAAFAGFDRFGGSVPPGETVNPWLEFHAAFSVLSFGAFALAGLAGGMYLWQERQLKTHRLRSVFFQLPPIADLGRLNYRLLAVGFVLLSLGLVAGVGMGVPNTWPHLVWAVVVWAIYGVLVQARWGAVRIGPRRVASLSVAAFTVALLTLGGLSFVTTAP